jgi:hypothetical protein
MLYEFTPEERIQNILHVLRTLNELLNDCDTRHEHLWNEAIKSQLINLDEAVCDMKAKV